MDSALDKLTPVQRVAVLGLRLRALDARSDTPILGDSVSVQVAEALGLDLSTPKIPRSVVLVHAVRARMLDRLVVRFVTDHPTAVVIDLGCGLDSRRQRCAPPPEVDWYDVDFPAITGLREQLLPGGTHLVGTDITVPGWLGGLPRERPAMVVTDGLMALLSAESFIGTARAMTAHFASGELAFNAYSRLAMRNSRRVRGGPLHIAPTEGEGIDDPREPETWAAGLSLIDEHFMGRAPEVALYPPGLRALARVSARSTRLARATDRVTHYRFSHQQTGDRSLSG